MEFNSAKKKKQVSVLPVLVKAFGPTFIFGASLKLLQDILTFVSPQILKYEAAILFYMMKIHCGVLLGC